MNELDKENGKERREDFVNEWKSWAVRRITGHLTTPLSFNPPINQAGGYFYTGFIAEKSKVRKVKRLLQGHTAPKWKNWIQPFCLAPKPVFFIFF